MVPEGGPKDETNRSRKQSPRKRRFSEEFKQDAVRLVVEEKYSFKAAATAVGVSEQSLRDWHAKFAPPPTPCGENATRRRAARGERSGCASNSSGPSWSAKS